MSSFSYSLLFLLLLILKPFPSFSGHIYTQPTEIVPQNAKYAKNFHLFFSLESPLSSSEYIYVKFPFNIGSGSKATLFSNLDFSISYGEIALKRVSGTENEHFFQLPTGTNLLAGTWYRLNVNSDSSKISEQTVGAQGCINLQTTSDFGESRITYDLNRCADYISLGPLVDTNLFKVEGSYSVKNSAVINTFGQSYTAFFDVRPGVEIEGGSIFVLTIDKTDFSFGSACASVSCSIASAGAGSDCPGAYDIPIVTGTCISSAQTLTFNLNQRLSVGSTFRIQATIINAKTLIATARDIYAVHKSRKAETWFGYTTVLTAATNGLSLKTAYSSITIQNSVSLFWGLSYASSQPVGCPIFLYRTNSVLTIFNSLTSTLNIQSQIQSLPSPINYIIMNWYPVDGDGTISSMIMSSFSTTLPFVSGSSQLTSCTPQTTSSTPIMKYVYCKNIDSIPSGSYKVSIKVSLDSSKTTSQVGVGKVEFKTGETVATTITSASAITIGVKKNFEYVDASFTASSLTKVKLNTVYSYKKDDLALTPLTKEASLKVLQGTRTTMLADALCYFLGDTCTDPKKGRAGVWAKPTTDADSVVHGIFIPLAFVQVSGGTTHESAACLVAVGAQTDCLAANHATVMLKIIFNNNVLNIPSSDLTKGAYLVGTMFAKFDGVDLSAGMSATVKDYATDSNSNFIASTNGFYHLTIVCKTTSTEIDGSCFNSLAYNLANSYGGGIALYNTKIAAYPSNYVDDKVLDFMICFKAITYASFTFGSKPTEESWTLLEQTTTAGPGMINSYVITGIPTKSSLSYVNYYKTAAGFGSGDAFASYVRAYAQFDSGKIPKAGSNIGIFFDGVKASGSVYGLMSKYANNRVLNVVNHVAGSQTAGAVLEGVDEATPTSFIDYWWVNSGVRYAATISTSEAYVNVYIPLVTGVTQWTAANIVIYDALNSNTQQYPVNGIFRIFGSIFGTTAPPTGVAISDFASAASSNSYALVESAVYQGTANNCFGSNTKVGLSDSATMKPGVIYDKTLIKINADVTNSDLTDCGIKLGNDRTSAMTIGSVFAIYATETENIFTQTAKLTWDYEGTGIINKCIFHNFGQYSGGVATINYYTILCQADAVSLDFGSSSKGVTFSTFTTPFYWGENYLLTKKVYYVWSKPEGTGVLAIKESASTSTWSHKTCSVTAVSGVSQDTKDVSYQLVVNTQVTYRLPKATGSADSLTPGKISFSISVPSSAPTFISCEHSSLVCSMSTQTVILSNFNVDSEFVLSKGSISITIIVDTPAMSKTTHSCNVKYADITTEQCSTEGNPVSFDLTATSQTSVISLDKSPKFVNMKGARGTFSFSFMYTRPIRKGYVFIFNLGFFVGPTATAKNFRCVVTNQNGLVSNNFISLSTKDLTKSTLEVRSSILSGGTFIYKCIGASTTDFSQNSQNSITATYERVSPAAIIGSTSEETKIPVISSILDSASPASISLNKLYRTLGFDSDYTFTFLPYTNDVGLNGRIIVEFSACIPPKLNSGGIAECYLNEVPAFCSLTDERRVSVWPNTYLRKNSTKSYTLKIAGVTQPTEIDENGQIYFALDSDDNPLNGLIEQAFIQDVFESTGSLPSIIYIHDFSITTNKIRTTTSISVQVLLPANTMVSGGSLYAQFPASFSKSLFYSPSATCSVKRVSDSSGSEYSRSCNLLRGRKFIINLSSDALNTIPLNYTIIFANLLSPQKVDSLYFREDIRIFTLSTDNTTILATTATGNRNSSLYLSFIAEPNVILLNWLDSKAILATTYVDVNVGLYKSMPAIATSGDNFNNTFNWQFGGNNLSSFVTTQTFSIDQTNLKIVTGSFKSQFYIGAKESVMPGIYYLSTTKNGDVGNTYSQLPFLDIRAIITPCVVTVPGNTYNIPTGGFSAPIALDFSKCIPMTDVVVTANLTNGNLYSLKFENGLTVQSQTLKYDNINSNYMLYFYVLSETTTANITSGSSVIQFTVSGTDASFITIQSSISVALMAPSIDSPVVQNPQVYPNVGVTTVSFSCSQPGNVYFAIGLYGSSSKVTLASIIAATQKLKISLTNPKEDDLNYLIFGYSNYPQANIYQGVEIANRLKAGDNYTVVTYCVNQNNVASSNFGTMTFVQSDNGAKTLGVTFKFRSSTLTDKQRSEIACGITRYFAIPPKRVLTEDAISCTTLYRRDLQILDATNSSNSSTSSAVYNQYSWYIIKDYLSGYDQSYQTFQTQMRDVTFSKNVFQMTTLGEKGFPLVDSVSYQVVDSYSTLNSANVFPLMSINEPIVTDRTVSLSVSISNIDGYLYAGLGGVNAVKPSLIQLRKGLDGNGTTLLTKYYFFAANKSITYFNFTNLVNKTNYTLYFGASNTDPSINSLTTEVYERKIRTLDPLEGTKLFILYSFMVLSLAMLLGH